MMQIKALLPFFDAVLRVDDNCSFSLISACSATSSTNINYAVNIAPTMNKNFNVASNCGNVTKIRPIAMSALFTCMLPPLSSGGNIVAFAAPGGTIQEYFYNTTSQGPYQEWGVLAQNNKGVNTLDGKLLDGCFAYYQPYDLNDLLLRTPTEANDYQYPGIVISGQVSTSATNGYIEIGRLRVITLFEYTTNNPLFVAESQLGTSFQVERVMNFVTTLPHAMKNKSHIQQISEYIKRFASGAIKAIGYARKGLDVAEGIGKLML